MIGVLIVLCNVAIVLGVLTIPVALVLLITSSPTREETE